MFPAIPGACRSQINAYVPASVMVTSKLEPALICVRGKKSAPFFVTCTSCANPLLLTKCSVCPALIWIELGTNDNPSMSTSTVFPAVFPAGGAFVVFVCETHPNPVIKNAAKSIV